MRTPMLPDDYQHYREKANQRSLPTRSGRMWARASLIFAGWSLVFAPAVFGPLGIVAGCVAAATGDRWWGAAGISASVAAAVAGHFWIG